jgi:hypothetical protein
VPYESNSLSNHDPGLSQGRISNEDTTEIAGRSNRIGSKDPRRR